MHTHDQRKIHLNLVLMSEIHMREYMFVSNACTIAISFVKSYFSINCNKHCEHLLTTVCAAVIPVVFSICVAPHLCIATAVTRPAGLTVNS